MPTFLNGDITTPGHLVDPDPRESFADIPEVWDYPDFLDVQLKTFHDFVQDDVPPADREDVGLQAVFNEHFPIKDNRDRYTLEFVNYELDAPKHTVEECIAQGLTYSIPLKATLRLTSKEEEGGEEAIEAIEQEVYLGTLPFMTDRGTFIVNGAERVIVSQLHRSPGAFFEKEIHSNGTELFSARVIPFRGSWMEFSTDVRDVLWAYVDRKKKVPVTTLLRALGFSSDEEIVKMFDLADAVDIGDEDEFEEHLGRELATSVTIEKTIEIVDEDTGEVVDEEMEREVLLPAEHELEEGDWEELDEYDVSRLYLVREDVEDEALDKSTLVETLQKDSSHTEEEALEVIYEKLRGSEAPDLDSAREALERLFFNEDRYDLGDVGRHRMNARLDVDVDTDEKVLTKEDVVGIVRELIRLQNGESTADDIDHLSNRRVKSVGEQLGSQFSLGLARMARTIKERMNLRDADKFTPKDLVNARTIESVINTFFGTNQLSQFMDQTNALAEMTHKRRMSALGPGGLTRERAGFEVRDVHHTHYGRLCPIETPEGPNIGLMLSLCVHSTINDFGFLETPYRVVEDGRVTDRVEYLSAEEEDQATVAQANAPIGDDGHFERDEVRCRHQGDFPIVEPEEVDYMDVAPNQIVSPSASLVPFLSHNDANRALMGSNMQRQGVPLLRSDSPIVGTGLEGRVAKDSRSCVVAEGEGVVEYVDAERLVVRYDEEQDKTDLTFGEPVQEYELTKFRRTNQGTCMNQKPIVQAGDRVEEGEVLTDGFAMEKGELALGKNVLCAFMPWHGYNYEDAIVISERLVADDVYTSVHIEEFEHEVRDTKRGEEELTREIPNVSEEATKDLDERGIVRVGAEITPGDIIVGKITPKGETDPTPEEKLLRAIFGDKAGDVKDASLKAKPGMEGGVVIDTRLFSRRELDPASKKMEEKRLENIESDHERKLADLNERFWEKFFALVEDATSAGLEDREGEVLLTEGADFEEDAFDEVDPSDLSTRAEFTEDEELNDQISTLLRNYKSRRRDIEGTTKRQKHQVEMGDELPSGVVQMAKVYVARKKKIEVGDKMAGRHGNKGVIAKIAPVEDMPFLDDGTPVDLVLNPLGVPSRMNLGQIYETLLGWAGDRLGVKYATPIFDGASLEDVGDELEKAGLPRDGKVQLYDGRTGEPFDEKTTVGQIYMMKLEHLVEDKMHARSIGPYSLITQQPLGGKAQFGGQRLGEMEVWALYAYGASNTLQEMLTFKSDDVEGRSEAYESIVKGENLPSPGVPESFNVLVRELQGLGLEVTLD
ncbi:DNA-directed RNA polymerase subunit beta [Salinibacter ruber]|jgi:DNA-directed RNA polymerase subunit beta|uniref:DNA-directed RNA polymerase subunit beta n=3 Tax=Salinibacter ruber TaxID=146919 RepID=RPOB_SALRD|nr:DNA-directed RNA polymerase subunit beta [Salinibacter ruber]Q2S1Q5.2 RecName: Full=DNA-directed RNA polymerase subunit beta; Short=RNAP subunit beta; AltName: Full=RNA polymerase subunit beta; AltName: Full=Transcriptase subunit beta [Salinibacter ruber DSM 13855]MBB4060557.1 DNA-directed RNA polymerase subunit beta [Salinibacter ruber]MBB4067902.1 DNA-directed RNA polymerase subunit beta [Salinibacter ruber]MBB4091333.1 DNA-directed RNA polymerase subunit beta [Salinibacter ruber]MCS36114